MLNVQVVTKSQLFSVTLRQSFYASDVPRYSVSRQEERRAWRKAARSAENNIKPSITVVADLNVLLASEAFRSEQLNKTLCVSNLDCRQIKTIPTILVPLSFCNIKLLLYSAYLPLLWPGWLPRGYVQKTIRTLFYLIVSDFYASICNKCLWLWSKLHTRNVIRRSCISVSIILATKLTVFYAIL